MAYTTTTTISAPVNVVFQNKMLAKAKPYCPYFVGSKGGDMLASKSGSYTVKWRRYENITPTTTALTELTGTASFPTRTGSSPSITDVTAAVSKYGDFFIFNEDVDLLNVENLDLEFADVLGIQAGRSLNYLQRNVLEDGLTLVYEGAGSTDGSVSGVISAGTIANALNTLQNNSAMTFAPMTTGSTNIGTGPVLPSFWMICHANVGYDVSRLSGFKSVETYAGQVETMPNELGYLSGAGVGLRVVWTEEASIDSGLGAAASGVRTTTGNADLYTAVIFGQQCHGALSLDRDMVKEIYQSGDRLPAIILLTHPRGSAGAADPYSEVATVAWKSWHAGKVLNSNWGRGIRCAASALA